jgi:S-disulfanyl-L-cysteine oxidoreductase SoxD
MSIGILFAAAVGLCSWLGVLALRTPGGAHFADADDAAMVRQGKSIYLGRCASCHGRNLQGQPLWQLTDEFAGRRAPAHDKTGHTWQHSDEDLFYMTKYGRFPGLPASTVSFMPAFRNILADREIIAVMAFMKAAWPTALRVSQAMLNPDHAGMPQQADETGWRFPPTSCSATRRRQAAPAAANPAVAGTAAPM